MQERGEEMTHREEDCLDNLIKRRRSVDLKDSELSRRYLTYKGKEIDSVTMSMTMIRKIKMRLIDSLVPGSSGWSLVYSTDVHGYALSTLMANAQQGPSNGCYVLVCLEDGASESEYERVFGAVFTTRMVYKTAPFGTPSTALFVFKTPRDQNPSGSFNTMLNVYSADGDEKGFYIMAKKSYIAFGCSHGRFGLLLNQTMLQGQSHPVDTFKNERLSLKDKFGVRHLELWHVLL
ncbi:hypothetical protein NEDG_01229 [Nematocida displodere]|uniref:Oxidation resistance protein 1 n=1 Tax=Nematocida displodere TaxID=1805483 RepID=A0A177ECH5_9MICR|nr:hypothetical protein NEDG_01229 [Nematocida displodere]